MGFVLRFPFTSSSPRFSLQFCCSLLILLSSLKTRCLAALGLSLYITYFLSLS